MTTMKQSLLVIVISILSWPLTESIDLALETGTTGCRQNKLDIVIALDSSGSVGMLNFIRTKNFTNSIVANLDVAEDKVRIAVVRFATRATVITRLNKHMDKNGKMGVVKQMAFKPGSTYTDRALEVINNTVLTSRYGDRDDANDVIILTTDGASMDPKRTKLFATDLKKRKGLKIMVIGIGAGVKTSELADIATDPSFVYRVAFTNLWQVVKNISDITCPEPVPVTESTTSETSEPTTESSTSPSTETSPDPPTTTPERPGIITTQTNDEGTVEPILPVSTVAFRAATSNGNVNPSPSTDEETVAPVLPMSTVGFQANSDRNLDPTASTDKGTIVPNLPMSTVAFHAATSDGNVNPTSSTDGETVEPFLPVSTVAFHAATSNENVNPTSSNAEETVEPFLPVSTVAFHAATSNGNVNPTSSNAEETVEPFLPVSTIAFRAPTSNINPNPSTSTEEETLAPVIPVSTVAFHAATSNIDPNPTTSTEEETIVPVMPMSTVAFDINHIIPFVTTLATGSASTAAHPTTDTTEESESNKQTIVPVPAMSTVAFEANTFKHSLMTTVPAATSTIKANPLVSENEHAEISNNPASRSTDRIPSSSMLALSTVAYQAYSTKNEFTSWLTTGVTETETYPPTTTNVLSTVAYKAGTNPAKFTSAIPTPLHTQGDEGIDKTRSSSSEPQFTTTPSPPYSTPGKEAPTSTPEKEAPTSTPEKEAPTSTPEKEAPTSTPEKEAATSTPEKEVSTSTPSPKESVVKPENETMETQKVHTASSRQKGENGDNDDEPGLTTVAMTIGLGVLGVILFAAVTSCLIYALRRRKSDDEDVRKAVLPVQIP